MLRFNSDDVIVILATRGHCSLKSESVDTKAFGF